MTINQIMERDIAEAEREAVRMRRQEPRDVETRCDRILAWLCTGAIVLAALAAAFAAGMDYQSRRDEKALREREAAFFNAAEGSAERVRAMSNRELLEAERKSDAAR